MTASYKKLCVLGFMSINKTSKFCISTNHARMFVVKSEISAGHGDACL
jgi:hypothetical protein